MKKSCLFGLFMVYALVKISSANAALLTYQYSGTISSISGNTGYLTGSGITPGVSTFTGTFTYDPDTAATHIGTDYADYVSGKIALTIDGTKKFSGPTTNIQVNNDSYFHDRFSPVTDTLTVFEAPTGDRTNNIQIQLQDNTDTIFSSTALPTSLELSDFSFGIVDIRAFFNNGDQYTITGSIVSLTAVPIPPAIWLFGSGLLGLVGISRRKK